jgi:hypothetical protein
MMSVLLCSVDQEFFFNWQSVSQKVLDVNKVKQEALACAIL